jgi:tRNA threonylcarbamoyladenosine biosynthesis protein TsaB
MDTTSEWGSLAVVRDGILIEELPVHSPEGYGGVLFPQIQTLLQRHGLRIADVDCFATATGPGSFTGVRISITAAKGLAESTGKLVAGVSNLRAIAWHGAAALRAPVIDARRGEVYGGLYDAELREVQHEVVMPPEQWFASLPEGCEVLCNEPDKFPMAKVVPTALAGAIGMIASAPDALHMDPAALDANYVRRSDAELMWKEA